MVIKSLTSNNPRAPHNLVQFSFKDRVFKTDQNVDQMVFHVNVDGNILMEDSLEYEDQKQYWENKKKMDAKLLLQMNKEINQEENGEQQLTTPFDEKKSLRNTFNF